MKSKNFIFSIFALTFVLFFNITISAHLKITLRDKREIIKLILQKQDFSSALEYVPDGTLFLSTENIPVEIQKNFPLIKGVKFQFITPKEIEKSFVEVHRFAFEEFKIKKQSVEVEFKEINSLSMDGIGYSCRKIKGKWRIRINKIIWEMA